MSLFSEISKQIFRQVPGTDLSFIFVVILLWASQAIAAVPSAPTGLKTSAGNAQVLLTWNVSAGALSYNVKRATIFVGPYTVIKSGLTTTSYTDTTALNGTKYYYVVSGVNTEGESPNSSQKSATPMNAYVIVAGGVCIDGGVNSWDPYNLIFGGASCAHPPLMCSTGVFCKGDINFVQCPVNTTKIKTFGLSNYYLGGEGAVCVQSPSAAVNTGYVATAGGVCIDGGNGFWDSYNKTFGGASCGHVPQSCSTGNNCQGDVNAVVIPPGNISLTKLHTFRLTNNYIGGNGKLFLQPYTSNFNQPGMVVAGGTCVDGAVNIWDPQGSTFGGASCAHTPEFCSTGVNCPGYINSVICPSHTTKVMTSKLSEQNIVGGEGALCILGSKPQNFGYFFSASNDTGDYANPDLITNINVQNQSNFVNIGATGNGGNKIQVVVNLLNKAKANGLKAIVSIGNILFDISSASLRSNYKDIWTSLDAAMGPYKDSIIAFYVLDEPYLRAAISKITSATMYNQLTSIGALVKASTNFSNTPVAVNFSQPEMECLLHGACGPEMSPITSIQLPSNLDWYGFDCYSFPGQINNCDASPTGMQQISSYFGTLKGNLMALNAQDSGNRKIFFIPQATVFKSIGNVTGADINGVVSSADYYNYLASTEPMVVTLMPFMWQSPIAGNSTGAGDLPDVQKKYGTIGSAIKQN